MIGETIKEMRKKRGWTQDELAKKMGYSDKATICKIEKNVNDVNQSTIKKFADVFGVDVADFFSVSPISQEDIILIELFNQADEDTQNVIKRLLGYVEGIHAIHNKNT